MHHATNRVLKYGGILGSCAAFVVCTMYVTQSTAESSTGSPDEVASASANPSREPGATGITIPKGYRDWRLVSVAHEAGNLNDIRAILGNDATIKAYREHASSFPDGAVIARLAWKFVPSETNDRVFGRQQSFVAGPQPNWYLQLMVKDSRKYSATGGWGFAQFDKDGNPSANEAQLKACFPCHTPAKGHDYVFTQYAP
jgi:hypothetical protein